MDSWLNYHHLYYFKVIAQEGSIARASDKLRLGQPTLSAQLKTLESKLGVPLFERKHRKLILTESGRMALKYADEIFRTGSELVEVLQDRRQPDRIHVELGALDSIPKHLISRLVKAAHEVAECTVTLLEGTTQDLTRELLAHRVDLILTNHPHQVSGESQLRSKKIIEYPIQVYAHPKFKHLRDGFPGSLSGVPTILPTAHSRLRFELDHYFETQKIHPLVVAETQDTALQKILGVDGLGVVPLPELAAASLVKSKELIEIGKLKGVTESIYLISGKRKIENPVSEALLRDFRI
jgi:LysR family transcriptional activator of nhaA